MNLNVLFLGAISTALKIRRWHVALAHPVHSLRDSATFEQPSTILSTCNKTVAGDRGKIKRSETFDPPYLGTIKQLMAFPDGVILIFGCVPGH